MSPKVLYSNTECLGPKQRPERIRNLVGRCGETKKPQVSSDGKKGRGMGRKGMFPTPRGASHN